MTWPSFPSFPGPRFDFTLSREPKIETASFGDGYEQQTGIGVNASDDASVPLVWENLTEAEKDAFDDFLTAQAGSYFTYTVPGDFGSMTFSCNTWNPVCVEFGVWSFAATFKREFNVS